MVLPVSLFSDTLKWFNVTAQTFILTVLVSAVKGMSMTCLDLFVDCCQICVPLWCFLITSSRVLLCMSALVKSRAENSLLFLSCKNSYVKSMLSWGSGLCIWKCNVKQTQKIWILMHCNTFITLIELLSLFHLSLLSHDCTVMSYKPIIFLEQTAFQRLLIKRSWILK